MDYAIEDSKDLAFLALIPDESLWPETAGLFPGRIQYPISYRVYRQFQPSAASSLVGCPRLG